jgi:hypothetical protein
MLQTATIDFKGFSLSGGYSTRHERTWNAIVKVSTFRGERRERNGELDASCAIADMFALRRLQIGQTVGSNSARVALGIPS